MIKKPLSILLAAAVFLSTFSMAFANLYDPGAVDSGWYNSSGRLMGDAIRDGGGELPPEIGHTIHITYQLENEDMEWLKINGGNGTIGYMNYTYYWYRDPDTGLVEARPAYCITPNLHGPYGKGPDTHYSPGDDSAEYNIGAVPIERNYAGFLSAGWPAQSLASLEKVGGLAPGSLNTAEAFHLTKIALWVWMGGGDIEMVNSSRTDSDKMQAIANWILTEGNKTASKGAALPAPLWTPGKKDVDVDTYVQEITLLSSVYPGTNPLNGEFDLEWGVSTAVTASAEVYDISSGSEVLITMPGKAKAKAMPDGSGFELQLRVKYNQADVGAEMGTDDTWDSPVLNVSAKVPATYNNLFLATPASGNRQNFLVLGAAKELMAKSIVGHMGIEGGPNDLVVLKTDPDGNPVANTLFEITGPQGGAPLLTGLTDMYGELRFEVQEYGVYTVVEKAPAPGYMPAVPDHGQINVRYGEGPYILTFENEAYGKTVQGAAVSIKYMGSDGHSDQRVGTTGSDGRAYFDNLKPGAYEVWESAAPAGYILDTQHYTVTVSPASQNATEFFMSNLSTPGLEIIKTDKLTGLPVEGVYFDVTRDGAPYLGGVFGPTDATGRIQMPDLPPGTYGISEHSVPLGYVLDQAVQIVHLTGGEGTVTVRFMNDPTPGIHLYKIDSQTLKPIPGVVFHIQGAQASNMGYNETLQTDADGMIDLDRGSGVPEGVYNVTEISAPDGYVMDDATRQFEVKGSDDIHIVFTNTRPPRLRLFKYDEKTGQPLAGVGFRIARIEDASRYFDRVTDQNGEINIDGVDQALLTPGMYSVQEIQVPSGYILDETEHHVMLFKGQDSQIVLYNAQRPDLLIVKRDADTGERIAGVTFRVRKVESSTVTEVTTDASGEALLSDFTTEKVLPGVYEVTEIWVPETYNLDGGTKLVTLHKNSLTTVEFYNHKKTNIKIIKRDKITKDPIPYTKFQIFHGGNGGAFGAIEDLGFYWTDGDGEINIPLMEPGWYRVKELEVPEGYQIDTPDTIDLFVRWGDDAVFTFEDTPKSAMILYKRDKKTGELLAGAKFKVSYLSGTSGTGGTVIAEPTTSSNGTAVLTNLKAGTYVIEEVRAPEGYMLDAPPKTVYITGNEQAVVTVEFDDSKTGGLLIRKIDAVTKEPLAGVRFKVTDSAGAAIGTANGEYVTDSAGTILIADIPKGTLVVRETEALPGYMLDDVPQTVEVKDEKTYTLEFRNQPMGGLLIRKVDSVTGGPVAGARFRVTDSAGTAIGASGGEYVTDSAGTILIADIPKEGFCSEDKRGQMNRPLLSC